MSPELWQRVKPLFHAASEMSAAKRAPYLDQVCAGDPELRREVDRLLAELDAKSAVLDKSPLDLGLIDGPGHSGPMLQPGEVLADRFEVVRFVQAGGMGEVYEATDLDFGGSVALKTLRPSLVHDEASMGRFKREIQLAKRVSHKNLCRIFDGGWHRGGTREIAFLTMEFLHGATLAAHLKEHRPLRAEEALPLLRQMATGLAALHEAAIMHRDLKPGNVILVPVEDAPVRAVITDFGLARMMEVENQVERVTKGTGFLLGTPEYMAPEQLSGEKDSDLGPFSDIYSLGTVAYEMLCGRLPFEAAAVGTLIVQKLTQAPPTPSEIIPEISTGWEAFILRCLEREPEQRIQTAAELLEWLDALEEDPETARSLANRTQDSADAGAMALRGGDITLRPTVPIQSLKQELVPPPQLQPERLWRVPRWGAGLAVAAALVVSVVALLQWSPVRTPLLRSLCVHFPGTALFCELPADKDVALLPFQFTAATPDSKVLAAGLGGFLQDSFYRLAPDKQHMCVHIRGGTRSLETYGAALVLNGELSVSGDSVVLKARLEQLPREPGGDRLLMRTFDVKAPMENLQAAADRLLDSMAGMLEVKFPEEILSEWRSELPRKPEALEAYLRGRALLDSGRTKVGTEGEPELLEAAEQFNRAVDRDYAFALGHVGLADSYRLLFERTADPKWPVRSRNAYQEALGLHPEFATVHRGLGELEMALGNNPAARKQFAEANRIDPYDHDVQIKYAASLEAAGLSDETEHLWKHSIELRPECWYGYNEIARFYLDHGKKVDAAKAYQTIIRLAPDHATAHHNLAFVYIKIGRYDDAIERAADGIRFGHRVLGYSTLGRAYRYRGCTSDALLNLEYAITDAQQVESTSGTKYSRRYLLWHNLAAALEAAGRKADAGRAFRNAVEGAREFLAVESGNRVAQSYLALDLASLGDREQALREIEAALALGPTNEEVLLHAAVVYEIFGLRDRALDSLRLALANGLSTSEISQEFRLRALQSSPAYRDLLVSTNHQPAKDSGSTTLLGDNAGCPNWEIPGRGLRASESFAKTAN